MDQLTRTIIATVHTHPLVSIGVAAASVVAYLLLRRKPRIQRDADDRLAALRREKAERDGKRLP